MKPPDLRARLTGAPAARGASPLAPGESAFAAGQAAILDGGFAT